jgi:amino acid transporter
MHHKKISLVSLVLLIVAAIDSIRNLPMAALFGSSLIFFFALGACIFLVPTSLVAAELSALFPEKGGVYHWVKTAFGEKWAMLAIWLQWINTMVWYPTVLSFIAATAMYLINPAFAEHKGVLIACILGVFWTVTFINLRGLHFSARVTNICAVIGVVFPLSILIILGVIWFAMGNHLQIEFTASSILPSFSNVNHWVSLVAIMASFLGIELAGVHVNDIHNPQVNFPRAVLFSSLFILLSMLLGSLAIAIVIPSGELNLVSGVIQVLTYILDSFGLAALAPVFVGLIVIGTVGQITNWLISPAKGLMHAAEFGYMPPFFMRKNKHGVAVNILLAQGVIVSFACLIVLLVPGVNAFMWFLTALSTELYMFMYILMFAAALYLHHKYINRPKAFKIPGRHVGMWSTCLLGLVGCLTTVLVSFFPPDGINVGSHGRYAAMIAAGNLLSITPILLFFAYKRRRL